MPGPQRFNEATAFRPWKSLENNIAKLRYVLLQ